MDDGLYLGFDVGTQGTKGVVLEAGSGRVVARAAQRYGLIAGLPPGAAEQHPDTWVAAVAGVAARLTADIGRERIRGLGVSGQQHGLVLLDANDAVVRPAKLWCDATAAEEARELSAALERAVPAGFTAPKIRWVQRHEPENWRRSRSVLLPHDYINFRLTGRKTMEAGDASGTGLFDCIARRFDRTTLEIVDPRLSEMLPPILPAGAPAGGLSKAGADLLGLSEGITVAAGGGDNMMSAIGSGATRPGILVVSIGTSGTAFAYSGRPIIDPEGLIAAFCDSTGGWLPLLCVMNMTGVAEEMCAAFGASLDDLTAAAAAVPAGAGGLLLVPYFQGERVPNLPEASGALTGIRPGLLRPAHLFRAALEGTMLSLALGIERLERLGIRVESVRVVGGGAQNTLWCQILTDVLVRPVTRLPEPESAALGAAVQAWWTVRRAAGEAVGADAVAAQCVVTDGAVIAPDPRHTDVYRDSREHLRSIVGRLFG